MREEQGYGMIQGTKPQTLAYGLTDSPVGLAAWIVEKFRTWSDCGGDVERRFSKDVLLTNVMLYWVTGAINSSFWPYWARRHEPWPISEQTPVRVPTAYASFPQRDPAPAARVGGAHVPEHPPLDDDGSRWPLRRARGAGGARGRHPGLLPRAQRAKGGDSTTQGFDRDRRSA